MQGGISHYELAGPPGWTNGAGACIVTSEQLALCLRSFQLRLGAPHVGAVHSFASPELVDMYLPLFSQTP